MKTALKYIVVALLAVLIWYVGWVVATEWVVFSETQGDDTVRTACTMEAKVCPDGTAVGRTGPNCEFAPCPGNTDVSEDDRNVLEVYAEDLSVPWGLAFLPDGDLLITERTGALTKIDAAEGARHTIEVPGVKAIGEGGLLGIALHPAFIKNHFLYLYVTAPDNGGTKNKVVRYTYVDGMLKNEVTIIDEIPGASYHDGGRIAFGPDNMLYITTGDAGEPQRAPDTDSLAGKILRLEADGSIPDDNPFGNAVYSYGHRNPQGITWDDEGELWSTEHGRSGLRSGLDELNKIAAGTNYGWPESEGDTVIDGTQGPVIHSGPEMTWAPASAAFVEGSIFFGGLRGETLYEAVINDDNKVVDVKEHFGGTYGRLRTVVLGPDGMLYISTSNTDGRGNPRPSDDKILRVDPSVF